MRSDLGAPAIAVPPGATAARAAQDKGADRARRSRLSRAGIFVTGLLLNIVGLAAWLLSVLLTLPFLFAGLWVWAREFDWAKRLLARFMAWARYLLRRARAHPLKWTAMTAVGLTTTAAGYWLLA